MREFYPISKSDLKNKIERQTLEMRIDRGGR